MDTMSSIKRHADRTRGPQAKQSSRQRRADRVARERLANAAERAYLALLEGGKR